jgi:hypothetical protein
VSVFVPFGFKTKMILPKSGCKSEVYLQVQNHLRIQNRQLISQLCKEAGISSTEIVDKRSKSEKDIFSTKVSKKVKKHFEDAATNTNDGSSSDDGYR